MDKNKRPQNGLFCETRKDWHDWLASHHGIASEVWLQIKKAGSAEKGVSYNEAVEEAICMGWIDGKMYSLDADKYMLRFTPRRPGSIWSMTNRKRAEALIAEERMTEAGMAAIREAKENGRWQAAYSSKETPDIPKDLMAALQGDPVASRLFKDWSNSQKLQAVWWIEEGKQLKTREKRIAKIVSCARNKQKLF
ncbi:MAG: YdeI/OmpD-associated family protein [Bacteroidota bacterium]